MQRASFPLVRDVQRTIERYTMIGTADRLVVAVSGGPDSVALLAALAIICAERGLYLCAAHFNHRLRGAEADRDQQRAEEVAQRLGLPCLVGRSETCIAGADLEARARAARYEFLGRVADEQGCTKIATGHTLDDQAETILMRLLRGTGWDGLRGIRPVRDTTVIRPLIECSRADVLAFLAERGLPFCADSSNDDRRFLRNRVRHDVLPLLATINPEIKATLASIAEVTGAETELLDQQVASILRDVRFLGERLAVAAVRQAPAALHGRLIRTWLRSVRGDLTRLSAAHVRSVISLALGERPNGRVSLPGDKAVIREYDALRFGSASGDRLDAAPDLLRPGAAVQFGERWRISAELVPYRSGNLAWPADLWTILADAASVRAPLRVRAPRPGDRIVPFGMRGNRKLQDIFVDRKLPFRVRRECAVIECAGEVLWVPGVVRSRLAPITPATHAALRLRAVHAAIAGT